MLKTLTIVYREGLEEGTYFYPVLRLLAALRIMFFPNTIIRFNSMKVMTKLYNPTRKRDPLYFLVHITIICRSDSHCGNEYGAR